MGPDEYHGNVNNSAYTAVAARQTLRFAKTACDVLRTSGVPCTAQPEWARVADGLWVEYDAALQYHPEFEGYKRGDKQDGFVKQADVILLYALPLLHDAPAAVARNDLEYYANWTDGNGPAMTWSAFAMAYLFALADESRAASYFTRGYETVRMPFGVWDETTSGGCGNFLTGAGGFLQSVIHGYGGVRFGADSLTLTPRLPPSTGSLTVDGIKYRGASLRLDVATSIANLTLVRAAAGGTGLTVAGRPLEVGVPIKLALGRAAKIMPAYSAAVESW